MGSPNPGPTVQRSCALCGTVDDGPRNEVRLASGVVAFYHLDNNGDGVSDCQVPGADPYPDLDETPSLSQLRHATVNDPGSPTPDDTKPLAMVTTDAQDPDDPSHLVQTGAETVVVGESDDELLAVADALRAGRGV